MDRETERGTDSERKAQRDGARGRQRYAETRRHRERNLETLKPRVMEREGAETEGDTARETQR